MTKIKNVPFEFKNEITNNTQVLTLSGVIQKRYWSDDKYIDAKLVREALDGVNNDIHIKLNSPGGDVFQGVEIYNYLKDHSSNITVEVMGNAASAATFICAGADKVVMNVGTSFMIHEAETVGWGNKKDIQKTLQALETIDKSILSIYSERTGQSEEQLTEWIDAAKWFTAQETVDYGFADEIKTAKKEDKNIEDIVSAQVAQAMASFFNSHKDHKPINIENETGVKGTKLVSPKQTKSLINRLRKGE